MDRGLALRSARDSLRQALQYDAPEELTFSGCSEESRPSRAIDAPVSQTYTCLKFVRVSYTSSIPEKILEDT